jgi:hypothetical protein
VALVTSLAPSVARELPLLSAMFTESPASVTRLFSPKTVTCASPYGVAEAGAGSSSVVRGGEDGPNHRTDKHYLREQLVN